jgi:hypothetical protein
MSLLIFSRTSISSVNIFSITATAATFSFVSIYFVKSFPFGETVYSGFFKKKENISLSDIVFSRKL